ncbi:MAG: HEPN domain-containing protein [bacterium]|nr:HEPN domain-containing protein [bacterium]
MASRHEDWLGQAERDLQSARWQADGGFFEWTCFICHQASGKALKAVYQKLGGEAWGHSLVALLAGLQERASVVEGLVAYARVLDRFYIPARYPNSWGAGGPKDHITREDAEHALHCGEAILRFCHGLLAG